MIKKDRVGYEAELSARVPGFIALAPARPEIRRALSVKAARTDFAWATVDGVLAHALVDIDSGAILWTEAAAWAACCHARNDEEWGWRGARRCLDCGENLSSDWHDARKRVAA